MDRIEDFDSWDLRARSICLLAARLGADKQGCTALRDLSRARGRMAQLTDPGTVAAYLRSVVRDARLLNTAERIIETCARREIVIAVLGSPEYPAVLAAINDPPLMLFSRGAPLEELGRKHCLGVVGSRRGDTTTCSYAQDLSRMLASAGACVVSGLALGVDGAAHRGALEGAFGRLPTVAVLGTGVDPVYPRAHERLADRIVDARGILLSEFEPGAPTYPYNFVARNRIIAGLSRGVVIVQAAERSGSLVTAGFALDEGRDLFVVPGSPFDKRYGGSLALLRGGAAILTRPEDILEAYPELRSADVRPRGECSSPEYTAEETEILKALSDGTPTSREELEARIGQAALERAALTLEMRREIIRLPGNLLQLRPM